MIFFLLCLICEINNNKVLCSENWIKANASFYSIKVNYHQKSPAVQGPSTWRQIRVSPQSRGQSRSSLEQPPVLPTTGAASPASGALIRWSTLPSIPTTTWLSANSKCSYVVSNFEGM